MLPWVLCAYDSKYAAYSCRIIIERQEWGRINSLKGLELNQEHAPDQPRNYLEVNRHKSRIGTSLSIQASLWC